MVSLGGPSAATEVATREERASSTSSAAPVVMEIGGVVSVMTGDGTTPGEACAPMVALPILVDGGKPRARSLTESSEPPVVEDAASGAAAKAGRGR
jgi:hypothetical protein